MESSISYLFGYIQSFNIWNKALSTDAISKLYNKGHNYYIYYNPKYSEYNGGSTDINTVLLIIYIIIIQH